MIDFDLLERQLANAGDMGLVNVSTALQLFKNMVSKYKWISVEKKLPKKEGYVLATFKQNLPFIAMFSNGVFTVDMEKVYPSHWKQIIKPRS